jgi:uncharacterized membrane protein YjgN (DUF898 family)
VASDGPWSEPPREQWSQPQGEQWSQPADGSPPGYGYGYGYNQNPSSSDDTIILVIGILGLVFCQILAPVAWYMGKKRLNETRQMGYPESGMAKAGYILGIVGTAMVALIFLLYVVIFVVAIAASATPT